MAVREQVIISFHSTGTRRVSRGIDQIGRSADATRRTLTFLRSALVVIASAAVLRQFVELADSFELMRNRIRPLTANMRQLDAVQKSLFAISQETGTAFQTNAELFARLARSTLNLNLQFNELLDITKGVTQAAVLSGATVQETSNAVIQFAQGLAAGALRGDELRSVVEQFPRLADAIGKEFGVAGGELIAFAKANDGVLTTQRVIEGVQNALGNLNKEFSSTNDTIGRGLQRVNNALALFIGGVGQATGVTSALARALTFIADNIDKVVLSLVALVGVLTFNLVISQLATLNSRILLLGRGGVSVFGTMARAVGALLSPLSLMLVTLTGIGGLFKTVFIAAVAPVAVAARGVSALIRTVVTLSSALLTLGTRGRVALISLINPVAALSKAFNALKIAIVTNPLFLLGALIVGTVVAAFFIFQDVIEDTIAKFGGWTGIINTVLAAFNSFFSVAKNNFGLFIDAVLELFYDLLNGVKGVLNDIATGVSDMINFFRRQLGKDEIDDFKLFDIDPNEFEGKGRELVAALQKGMDEQFKVKSNGEDTFVETPLDRLKARFEGLKDFFKSFTSGGIDADALRAELDGLIPQGDRTGGGLGDSDGLTADEIDSLRDKLRSLEGSVSPTLDILTQMKEAQDTINEATAAGIPLRIEEGELMRRLRREAIGVGNADIERTENIEELQRALNDAVISQEEFNRAVLKMNNIPDPLGDYTERMKELNAALEAGAINQERFRRLATQARIDFLDTQTDIDSGIERAFLKMQEQSLDFATVAEEAITGAFEGATDAIVDFVRTGKLEMDDLFANIQESILRLALQDVGGQLGGLLGIGQATGNNGGFLQSLFDGGGSNILSSLLPFADGGSMVIGGVGGVDQNMLSINNQPIARVSRGERLDIVPREQQGPSRGGSESERVVQPITIHYNISTPDANSFRRSQSQIMTEGFQAAQRANRRNG